MNQVSSASQARGHPPFSTSKSSVNFWKKCKKIHQLSFPSASFLIKFGQTADLADLIQYQTESYALIRTRSTNNASLLLSVCVWERQC